jgi:hypothetical protein
MVITYLTVLSARDRFWYERLSQLARDMGAEIRYTREQGDDPKSVEQAWRSLRVSFEESDANGTAACGA